MTKPGRRLRLMMLCLLLVLAAPAAANWLINPFGAWPSLVIDGMYRQLEIGTERVRLPYRLRTEESPTLLVGSSRVLYGMPIEQGSRDGVLNAALSGASMDEIATIIRVAMTRHSLERVVWGLDFYAFGEDSVGFRDADTRSRLEGDSVLLIRETLLSRQASTATRDLWRRARSGRANLPAAWLLPVPWPEQVISELMQERPANDLSPAARAELEQQVTQWAHAYAHYNFSARQLALFRDAVTRTKEAGVEAILFIPPLSACEIEIIQRTGRWAAFEDWKRALVSVSPYWDFSGYTELSRHDDLFGDMFFNEHFCHFRPAVGEVILRRLLGKDCAACGALAQTVVAAGKWVDKTTIDQHLAAQEAERRARTEHDPRCSKLAEAVTAQDMPSATPPRASQAHGDDRS